MEKLKIKGLANITDKDSDDTVVNKKYVDDLLGKSNNKLYDVDSNNPFVFKNEDGKEIVKEKDGKLYKDSTRSTAFNRRWNLKSNCFNKWW